jgi:hypothetical protein
MLLLLFEGFQLQDPFSIRDDNRPIAYFIQPAILLVIFIGLKLWNRRGYVKLGSMDALKSTLTTLDALIEAGHTSSISDPETSENTPQDSYHYPPPAGAIYSPTSPEMTSPNFSNGGVQNWDNPGIVMPPTITQLANRELQQQDPRNLRDQPSRQSIPSRSTSPLAANPGYELGTSVTPPLSPMSELGGESRSTSMVDGSLSAGDRVSGFSSYQWTPSGTGGAREELERARARQRSYNSLAEESAVSR